MPNWCLNTLTITGPDELVRAFHDGIGKDKDGLSLFQSYLPMPAGLGPGHQRLWQANNWGVTHGGDNDTRILDGTGSGSLIVQFETAWRPPSQALEALAAKFPGLRFENTYSEPNLELRGSDVYHVRRENHPEEYDRVVGDIRNAVKRAAEELDRIPPGKDISDTAWTALRSVRTLVAHGMEEIAQLQLGQGIER